MSAASAPHAPGARADRLVDAARRAGAPVCVGLDPVVDRLPRALTQRDPADRVRAFCEGVIDAVAPTAPAVKFQAACFERYRADGWRALEDAMKHARERGLAVILDAKRGDIGITAEHYAASALALGAEWITLSGYLGADAVEPFLRAGLGAFVLVRTSNPGSDPVQASRLAEGGTVAALVAREVVRRLGDERVGAHGYSDVGAVVGATKADEADALRTLMPRQVFLVPGYGAQGGTADDVRRLLARGDGRCPLRGVLVTASRSVIYPETGGPAWADAVAGASARLRDEIASILA